MSKKKKIIIVTVIVLVFVLAGTAIFGGVCMHLMTQDNISDKYTLTDEERDGTFLGTLLKAAITGSETELSEAQINTYLNDSFCGPDRVLRKIRVYFNKDEPVKVYARIFHFNRELAFSSDADLTLEPENGRIAVRIYNVKLGELNVHSPSIDSVLEKFAGNTNLAEYTNGILYIKTEYSYDGKNFSITLRLEKFQPQNGSVLCKTNSLSRELLYALKDYLRSEDGQSFIKQYIGEKLNDFKNRLIDFFF